MEYNYDDIDFDRLRKDLEDYFTSAYFIVSPLAIADMSEVENASNIELIDIAQKNGFDISNYLNFYSK